MSFIIKIGKYAVANIGRLDVSFASPKSMAQFHCRHKQEMVEIIKGQNLSFTVRGNKNLSPLEVAESLLPLTPGVSLLHPLQAVIAVAYWPTASPSAEFPKLLTWTPVAKSLVLPPE